MQNYFNSEVGDLSIHEVKQKLRRVLLEIVRANNFIDTYNDNLIADLHRRSARLGEPTSIVWSAENGGYIIQSDNAATNSTMSTNTQRTAFEAFVRSGKSPVPPSEIDRPLPDGSYRTSAANAGWVFWQAATKQQLEEK